MVEVRSTWHHSAGPRHRVVSSGEYSKRKRNVSVTPVLSTTFRSSMRTPSSLASRSNLTPPPSSTRFGPCTSHPIHPQGGFPPSGQLGRPPGIQSPSFIG